MAARIYSQFKERKITQPARSPGYPGTKTSTISEKAGPYPRLTGKTSKAFSAAKVGIRKVRSSVVDEGLD